MHSVVVVPVVVVDCFVGSVSEISLHDVLGGLLGRNYVLQVVGS